MVVVRKCMVLWEDPKHDTGAVAVRPLSCPSMLLRHGGRRRMSRWNCRCRRCCCCSSEESWPFLGGASSPYDDDDRPSWWLGPERGDCRSAFSSALFHNNASYGGVGQVGRPCNAVGKITMATLLVERSADNEDGTSRTFTHYFFTTTVHAAATGGPVIWGPNRAK
jgi:hypothetical protein